MPLRVFTCGTMAGTRGIFYLVVLCVWYCAVGHALPQLSNFPQKSQDSFFQQSEQQFPQQFPPKQPVVQSDPLDKCTVDDSDQIQCGQPGISGAECQAINCCFNGQQCYYGKTGKCV